MKPIVFPGIKKLRPVALVLKKYLVMMNYLIVKPAIPYTYKSR